MADESCTPEYSHSIIDRTLLSSDTEEKLATSLTADMPEMIPYLPYLLQDLWELGSNPRDIIKLISKHIAISTNTRILDLACGKGSVSVLLAKEFNCKIKGIDIFPEFIDYAWTKAAEYNVSGLCEFTVDDINHAVSCEKDYDIVILGAVGDVLGEPDITIAKLKKTIKPSGYIVIDDGYVAEGSDSNYHTRAEWMLFFVKSGVMLIDEMPSVNEEMTKTNNYNQERITARANELKQMHPEKSALFEQYVQSQQAECDQLENDITGVTWLLQSVK
jgi:2-polyprenyl-3-methyl-5-hydroxy-6-metoxy-1,4-benzoquinol methylase